MNKETYLVSSLSEEAANVFLSLTWLQRLSGWKPVKLERVWLPCREVILPPAHLGQRASKGIMLVNGFARKVHALPRESVTRGSGNASENESRFSFPLSASEAIEVAREQLLQWRMNRVVRTAIETDDLQIGEVFFHPHWVQYAQKNGGALKVAICDAVTGRKVPSEIKQGFLDALEKAKD